MTMPSGEESVRPAGSKVCLACQLSSVAHLAPCMGPRLHSASALRWPCSQSTSASSKSWRLRDRHRSGTLEPGLKSSTCQWQGDCRSARLGRRVSSTHPREYSARKRTWVVVPWRIRRGLTDGRVLMPSARRRVRCIRGRGRLVRRLSRTADRTPPPEDGTWRRAHGS